MAKATKRAAAPKRTEVYSAGYGKGSFLERNAVIELLFRRGVKIELQRTANYSDDTESVQVKIDFIPMTCSSPDISHIPAQWILTKDNPDVQEHVTNNINWGIAYLKNNDFAPGGISDGYHTFDELYEHRIVNFIALCRIIEGGGLFDVWRSTTHSDGSVWDGWFILGINHEPGKQITYHLPVSKWEETAFASTLDCAPEFDGHTSADVLERIKQL